MLVSVMPGSVAPQPRHVDDLTGNARPPQVLGPCDVRASEDHRLGGMLVLRRLALATTALVLVLACTAQARIVPISEYRLSDARLDTLRDHWVDQLLARHSVGTWAPMKFTLTNADLKLMGLPPKRVLLAHHYRRPTVVRPDGRMWTLGARTRKGGHGGGGGSNTAGGGTISYAGAGFFGIRPGAWLLTVTDKEIGWCSMAHVYGTPGAYQISTAGHCGKVGDTATVIGAVGDHQVGGTPVPVLLDFGKYTSSTGDAGIGKDWALISVDPSDQALVSPTMAFWGGPRGMFTSVGEVARAHGGRVTVGAHAPCGSVFTFRVPSDSGS
jgi:hypothetical protein